MKANEVMNLLKISRPTLIKYVKNKWISEEIFEEIVHLIHAFSMKLYSSRRGKKIEIEEKE